ncbi:hypothetical protein [Lapidilactobacillus wuchangensis]|uniref:hypothetical protein n=1 Tax=Lapidilactobacillus wuchangensis TaxID=2486001 RepID=UPI000F7714C4|nr:hypothetical protein [Lapidilactobacillus wuchangensis]
MSQLAYWEVAQQMAMAAYADRVDQFGQPVIKQLKAIVTLITTDTLFQWLLQASVEYRSQDREYIRQHFAQEGISLATETAPDFDPYTQSGPVDLVGSIVADKIQQRLQQILTAVVYLQGIVKDSSQKQLAALQQQAMPQVVLQICTLLNSTTNLSQRSYFIKLREHDLATIVKLAELNHDLTMIQTLPRTEQDVEQQQHDQWAINILKSKYSLKISPLVPNRSELTADS